MSHKLVIFDVDGTLIDSIAHIEQVMEEAFLACDLSPPAPGAVRALVGISLPGLMAQLQPDLSDAALQQLIRTYKQKFATTAGTAPVHVVSPLFPGTRAMLDRLAVRDDVSLGIATGKSRRGLERVLLGHGMMQDFITCQVADDHPSKPHPSMVEAALGETLVEPRDAVLIGDTTYDLQMARAAGVRAVGVAWGNHAPQDLRGVADHMLQDWVDLDPLLDEIWARA